MQLYTTVHLTTMIRASPRLEDVLIKWFTMSFYIIIDYKYRNGRGFEVLIWQSSCTPTLTSGEYLSDCNKNYKRSWRIVAINFKVEEGRLYKPEKTRSEAANWCEESCCGVKRNMPEQENNKIEWALVSHTLSSWRHWTMKLPFLLMCTFRST